MNKGSLSVWNVKESQFPKNGIIQRKIKHLIRYGILAPSGHNSQPWKFLINKNILEIWPDYRRRREAVDPDDRELFISLGGASSNIEVAANYFGMIFDKEYVVEEKADRIFIRYTFKEGKKQSQDKEMFWAIPKRLTNRGDYEEKPIPKEELKKIAKEFGDETTGLVVITEKNVKNKLGELIYKSDRVWFKSKELVEELESWLRDDVEISKDGLPTGVLNLYKVAVNLKYFLAKDSEEVIKKASKDKELAIKSGALVVVTSKMDGVEHWMKTGEMYQKMLLRLTQMGVAQAYFNAVIELKTQRKNLATLLRIKGKPQMMLRLGYSQTKATHSPRRSVEEVLVKQE